MAPSSNRTNPFPGLRPFELDEEHLFFGREGQADELLVRLNRTRFLAVVGSSGSGKSSLVRAGLLPSLYSGFLADASSGWRAAILRPGSAPIRNLAEALNHPEIFGGDPTHDDAIIHTALTESTLRRGALGLVEVTQQARMAVYESLLVVVDQFEELFRFKQQAQSLEAEDEAAAFVKLLLAAVGQRDAPIFVVLTMRSDFLGDCAQFRDLPETLNHSQYLIPRLTRDQLRRAIEGPVAVGGGAITPQLVNRLLNDVGDNPDQLPILQHALMRTWDYWEDQATPQAPIDIQHYEGIGGMAQALSRHADQIYQGLPDARSRQIAETLFKRLTDRGADNREIRRPTQLAEICAVADADLDQAVKVIDVFRAPRRCFLMPPTGASLHETSVIDISHESLMRNWPHLKAWVTQEDRSAIIYRRLAETAALHGQGKANYLRDPELTIGLTWLKEQKPNAVWAERYAPNFDEVIAFLQASAKARDAEAAEKERARKRELNRLRTFLAVLGGLSLLTGGAAVYAFNQQQLAQEQTLEAQRQAEIATMQRNDATYQQNRAEEQAQEAERQADIAREKERDAKASEVDAKEAKDLAERQRQAAEAAKQAESAQRQQAQAAQRRAEAGEAEAQRQTEIAKQQTLNAEIQTGALAVENFMASGLNFKALLSGLGVAQRIRQLEATAGINSVVAIKSQTKANNQAAFTNSIRPSARLQAVSALRKVVYARGWREKNTLRGHSDYVMSLSFSPDGQTVASASGDGSIKLWDLSGRLIQTLEEHTDQINRVIFSPDGNLIASAGSDGTVRLWDITGQELRTLEGHSRWIGDLSFSPDGTMVASGGGDNTIRLWNVSTNESDTSPFLEEQGQLVPGNRLEDRDTFFTEHMFQGEEGQKVLMRLESEDFDPYLRLLNENGEIIAENDDAFDTNSALGITLPETGPYRIVVTSYEAEEEGVYNLSAVPDSSVMVLEGHPANVQGVSFSPDGNYIASASDDGTARLWDLQGDQIQVFEGHSSGLNRVYFSPDGKMLATTGEDNTARLWNIVENNKEPVILLQAEGQLTSEKLLEDRETFFTEYTFEGEKGQKVLMRLASEDFDTYLRLLNANGEIIAENDDRFGLDSGLGVTFPETGSYRIVVTAYAAEEEGQYTLSVKTGFPETVLEGHSDAVRGLSFSPKGNYIVTSSQDSTLRIWGLDGNERQVLKGHTNYVNDVSFSPNGTLIASASGDRTVKLWEQGEQTLHTLEGHSGGVGSVSFAPDGQTLASASADGTVKLWDISGRQLHTLEGHSGSVWSVSFAPDGQTIASASDDGTVQLWNREGQELQILEGHSGIVWSVSFAPDGQMLASASSDGTVKLWDISGRQLHTLEGHSGIVISVSFAPDGQTLASASDDGTVKLWDISGRQLHTLEGHSGIVRSVSFAPDGQTIASASYDGTVKLWDISGRELHTLEGHTSTVWSVSFAPDGQTLASASNDDTVKLWDISGQELQTLEGHTSTVWSVSFAPDGQTIASAADDGAIILWNFNLSDLIAKSCDWLRDYMANPATPPEDKALCEGAPSLSNPYPPISHSPAHSDARHGVAP